MPVSLQVLYPISNGSTFDFDYYTGRHMEIVSEYLGSHVQSVLVTKGLAGGPNAPPAYHAIASITFADQAAFDAALAASGPVMEDIPNFTNVTPELLIGDVLAS
ncbi:EthD family reductase [Coralliovum pocilloporae]|uniref:EthD family reductase n=1 Tax=Coralliovum pocilloporae TaxID=3066369 RepID=UPI003306DFDD